MEGKTVVVVCAVCSEKNELPADEVTLRLEDNGAATVVFRCRFCNLPSARVANGGTVDLLVEAGLVPTRQSGLPEINDTDFMHLELWLARNNQHIND